MAVLERQCYKMQWEGKRKLSLASVAESIQARESQDSACPQVCV